MQLTDDFKQTGGSKNAHRCFDTERSRYRQMCSHTGAFFISNMFTAGLGIDIKYCFDHGDSYCCIVHICYSMHSEHGEAMKDKLERSGFNDLFHISIRKSVVA